MLRVLVPDGNTVVGSELEELLKAPSSDELRFGAHSPPSVWAQSVDRLGPQSSEQVHNGLCAMDNPGMGPIVHC